MAFTYDLNSSDEMLRKVSQVRLHLGDTVENKGVRPDDSNLSDEEIAVLLNLEGDNVMRAVAAACEVLARMWARAANMWSGDRREELSQVALAYERQAKELRRQHGGGGTAFSISFHRHDAYSEHAERGSE